MGDRKRTERRRFVKSNNKMPKLLLLAELFIAILCLSYILKINGLIMDIAHYDGYPQTTTVLLLEMDIIFFGLTIFAALGVYSRRPESWRKVVRSSVTFTVATILSSAYSTSNSYANTFDFNPVVTGIALIALLLIMILSDDIKKFYTPPMMATPKTSEWIRYAFFGKLIDTHYSIVFKEGHISATKKPGIDLGSPEDLGPIVNEMMDGHSH